MKITNQTIYIYQLVLKETDDRYFESTVKITSDRM